MRRTTALAPASVVLVVVTLLLPSSVAAATYSKLWGNNGEKWNPAGALPDFSFAGYKQGNEPLPTLPVTRSVLSFKKRGMSDTKMLKAAVDWANKQPLTTEHIVLEIPSGKYTLTQRLWIRRSKVVLRGAGSHKTVFYMPKSLTGIYGKNPQATTGGYVNTDAFITIKGTSRVGRDLATAIKFAAKGDVWLQVDKPSALKVGWYYDMWWTDVRGRFNDYMFDNKWEAPSKYVGSTRVKFTTKILAIRGNRVMIERHLPYEIRSGLNMVRFHERPDTLSDSGVEGITFRFKWSWYAGHHLEAGWNAVEISDAYNCWIRDIASINADSTVLINGASSITVAGLRISASKTRANNFPNKYNERAVWDGHWGVQHTHSFDVLVRDFVVRCSLVHDVGTGSSGKWGVFMNGKMKDGNLDLHRALAGPTLYTNIDVGIGTNALSSGGPSASGPNALAGSTWWNIRSRRAVYPNHSGRNYGNCDFGPVINLVSINLIPSQARKMCKTWLYERRVSGPANIYEAQLARRRRLATGGTA